MWSSRLAQFAILLHYFFGRRGADADVSFGNELAQFQRYISIADQHGNLNASMMHEIYRETEGTFRACEKRHATDSKRECVEGIKKQQVAMLSPL